MVSPPKRHRSLSTPLLAIVAGLAIALLALPVVALLIKAPLRDVPGLLGDPAVREMIAVTARTNLIANVAIVALGTPTAYLLATRSFRGRRLLTTLLELPLVLPPAVAGIALLAAFGDDGLLGPALADVGVVLPLSEWAVVLAIVFVASPFFIRQAIAAFTGVSADLKETARTLGAGPLQTFRRVTLPLAAPGLLAGWTLAFARGIGEFGATVMFAGNVPGVSQTLPLGIYARLDSEYDTALGISVLLVVLSAAILLAYKLLQTRDPLDTRSL